MASLDLTITVPGFRNQNWENIYKQIPNACKKLNYEVLFVSPYPLPEFFNDKENVRYLRDLGSPNEAVQQAALLAKGEYFMWLVDDTEVLEEDSIDLAVEQLKNNKPDKDISFARYIEGMPFPQPWWKAWNHEDLRLPGIGKEYQTAPISLLKTKLFLELGGLDCKLFDHINMSVQDLAFRCQYNGGEILWPPKNIMQLTVQTGRTANNNAVIKSFHEKDKPNFRNLYSNALCLEEREVDLYNFKDTPLVWQNRKIIHDKK